MKLINIILLVILSNQIQSQSILGLKERARVISEIQKDRLDNLLPKLMDETGIDMWVLITREYNEDPIIKTLLPPTWLNARRRTIIAFYHDKDENKVDEEHGYYRFDYNGLNTISTQALIDIEKDVTDLEARVTTLEG